MRIPAGIVKRYRLRAHLLEYHAVNQPIKDGEDDARRDDGGEEQKDEIVVVHDFREEALVGLAAAVPAEDRKKSNYRAEQPAQTDDA